MAECPDCGMRDDDWFLCRRERCATKAGPDELASLERELAEARAEAEKWQSIAKDAQEATRLRKRRADEACAERDALAAAIQEAREVVSAIAGENQPAREWALRVRDKIDAALSGASTPAPAARLVTDTMVEAAASAMVKRGERRCALHAILKAAGMSYRERTAAVRATVEAALASIPAPALAEETRSLVREPMEWMGQGRYGFSSTVSAPIPAPVDKAEARREAAGCDGADDPEERCPRHPDDCACWKVDTDHPTARAISTPARREGE